MNLKEALAKGHLLMIQINEQPNGVSLMQIAVEPPEVLNQISQPVRAMLMAWNRAWSICVRRQDKGHDTRINVHIAPHHNLTPMDLAPHVDRTYQAMQNRWPYEAWFVNQHIFNEETAAMMFVSTPIFGGLQQNPSLIPSGSAGIICRVPSPVTNFPSPQIVREPSNLVEAVAAQLGAQLVSDAPVLDIEFPVNE